MYGKIGYYSGAASFMSVKKNIAPASWVRYYCNYSGG